MDSKVEILIVEDSLTQAEQLRYILEQKGYRVSVAFNGLAALDYLQEHQPTIVISDILMPVMDGYQLCKKIKENGRLKDIAVIILTSLSDPGDVIKGLESGADNFITKPYSEGFLLSRIHYILINRELRKSGTSEMGIEVFFAGQKHYLTAERIQMIDLLLSTYENAVQRTLELKLSNIELQKAIQTIRVLEANHRSLLERNADGMVVIGQDSLVRYLNPAAESLFNITAEKMLGEVFPSSLVAGEIKEISIHRGEGRTIIAEMRVAETSWEGDRAYLASLRDVTDNVRLRERLRNLSMSDELTGLYNRRGFLALIREQMAFSDQSGKSILLLYGDLDSLKWINDTFGHSEGDRVLIEAAEILRETFRESDLIARVGGDEFAVVVPGGGHAGASALALRLKHNLDARNVKGERPYKLSMSTGVACYEPGQSISIEEFLSRADRLMYENKRA
jgi:two-component system cell cycle response regulator